jgi:hypothetical protein
LASVGVLLTFKVWDNIHPMQAQDVQIWHVGWCQKIHTCSWLPQYASAEDDTSSGDQGELQSPQIDDVTLIQGPRKPLAGLNLSALRQTDLAQAVDGS